MSAQEDHVPSPPTWREYLDARLAPLATREFVEQRFRELESRMHAEINGVRGEINGVRGEINGVRGEINGLRTSMRNWLVFGYVVLGALITIFGLMNPAPPQ